MNRFKIITFLCCIFSFATHAQGFSIEDWLKQSPPTPIELSPSGNKVLWYNPETSALEVQNVSDRQLKRFALKSGESFIDASFTDESYIILQTERESLHRVYGIDSENTTVKLLIEQKGKISIAGNRASEAGFWIFQSNQLRYFSFDVWQFTRQLDIPELTSAIKYDHQNQPCLAITELGDVWWNYSSSWQQVKQVEDITRVEPDKNCEQLFTIARAGNTLSLIQLPDIKKSKVIYRHSQVDVSDFWIDQAEHKITGVFYQNALPEVYASSDSMARLKAIAEKITTNSHWQVLDQSESGEKYLITLESPTQPRTHYWIHTESAKVLKLTRSHAGEEKSSDLARTQVVETRVKGFNVTGYLTLPNKNDKTKALVVRFHGGPFAVRDYWQFDPEAQWFASKGIALMTLNYRGSAGFGLAYQQAAFGKLREVIEQDVDAMLGQVKRKFSMSQLPVCLYGASFGGFAVLSELIENSDEYRCGILVSGVTSLPKVYDSLKEQSDLTTFRKQFGAPENKEWQEDNHLLTQLAEIESPVLVIYGDQDERVSPEHSRLLIDGLTQLKKPVTALKLEGADHQLSRVDDRLALYESISRFLKRLGLTNDEI